MSLYKLLGVAKTASKPEIKVAYRKLALQFHPDKHAQSPPQARAAAAAKFRQISTAYETLIDDQKRAAYDRKPYNVTADGDNVSQSRQRYPSRSRDDNTGYPNGSQHHQSYPNGSQYRHSYQDRSVRMRAIRNYCLHKLKVFALEFMVWLLKEIAKALVRAFIMILRITIEEMLKKNKGGRRR